LKKFSSWDGEAGRGGLSRFVHSVSLNLIRIRKISQFNGYLRHFGNGIAIALAGCAVSAVSMDQQLDNIRLLTLDEAAALLQVSKRTLQRMIKIHELPAFKVGGQWRLRETQLRQWVEHRELSAIERERKGN
jgi:excisionase family DNA binding protein